MGDVVCVKIVKAFGYVQQLGTGRVTGQVRSQGNTYQADPVHTWVFLDELQQSSVRHPLRDDLQRVYCDPDERDDVRVR